MKNLFLCSRFVQAAELFGPFARAHMPGKELLFIPTASYGEADPRYVKAALRAFVGMGYGVRVLEAAHTGPPAARAALERAAAVFVGGGNTFYLLWQLQRAGLLEPLRGRVLQGMAYIGESAGAMLAAPDIDYCRFLDDPQKAPGLRGSKALGLTGFYTLPHYGDPCYAAACRQTLRRYGGLPLAPIGNGQALWVQGGQVRLLGGGRDT